MSGSLTGFDGALAVLTSARERARLELFTVDYAVRQLQAIAQICSRCGGPRAKGASSVCRPCYTNRPPLDTPHTGERDDSDV